MPLKPTKGRSSQSILVERYEAKYVIPLSLASEIREAILPFCEPDPNGEGNPPLYTVTTLQLDSPDLLLHHAKDSERDARFKLRVRIYGDDSESPVFVEVKRKIKRVVLKSRARVQRGVWCADLVLNPDRILKVDFRSWAEEVAFLEFLRLTREIGAAPKIAIRYTREAYISRVDEYARVSLDSNLMYTPTESWCPWDEAGNWRHIDSGLTQNKGYPFSGVVLELKTLSDVPNWIVQLTEDFDLERTGHCKYSNAIWEESIFRGSSSAPVYASDLLVP